MSLLVGMILFSLTLSSGAVAKALPAAAKLPEAANIAHAW